ncbi:hypothetical protein SAMN02910317_01224 [Ruminococcaceae bacterium FB2012]|nr:hypothetical protein SAMN02910317_01224 [Ruminococcaceae bacterium FB2012]
MAIKDTDVKALANLLFSNIQLKLDYKKYLSNDRKLLLVEGTTDERFVKHVKKENVDCVAASKIFLSNAAFSTKHKNNVSCKGAIYKLIVGISHYPSPFIIYPSDIDKWDLYGLIDRDSDEIDFSRSLPRLLVTDTHDLETLMLSTDDDIFFRLNDCNITQEHIDKAFYLAHQLSITKRLLQDYYDKDSFDLQSLSSGSGKVDFSNLFDGERLDLHKLLDYICEHSISPITIGKRQKLCETVCKSKQGKKYYNADYKWKCKLSDFKEAMPSDFWLIVNGHDMLQLLMFINEEANNCFNDSKGFALNRSFEMKLIDIYDYATFANTELSQKMILSGLISC